MEVQILITASFNCDETCKWFRTIFGEDPPFFEDEVPEKHRTMFSASEDISPPDELVGLSKKKLLLTWLLDSSWDEDVIEIGKALQSSGASNVIGYYWFDEEEGFFRLSNKLSSINDWRSLITKHNIKKTDHNFNWVKKVFTLIEKE